MTVPAAAQVGETLTVIPNIPVRGCRCYGNDDLSVCRCRVEHVGPAATGRMCSQTSLGRGVTGGRGRSKTLRFGPAGVSSHRVGGRLSIALAPARRDHPRGLVAGIEPGSMADQWHRHARRVLRADGVVRGRRVHSGRGDAGRLRPARADTRSGRRRGPFVSSGAAGRRVRDWPGPPFGAARRPGPTGRRLGVSAASPFSPGAHAAGLSDAARAIRGCGGG